MIRPRWKKVLADLWSNKVRSLLVIASIAVGLFAVGMIHTSHAMLLTDMRASYRKINPANIIIRANNFDPDFIERLRHLPGVAAAQGVQIMDVRLRTGPDTWIPISIQAVADIDPMQINQVAPRQGNWPPARREIALEINKLADTRAALGDEVEIKLPSGTVRKLRVTSVVHDLSIGAASGGGGYFFAPAQGFVSLDTLNWLEMPELLNQVYLTAAAPNDLGALQQVANRAIQEFDRNGYTTLNSSLRRLDDHPNSTYVEAISGVLIVLGLLVVFLSAFLITNTLSALLNQQIQQVGILKTFGAGRLQINVIYMVLIFIYSLLALLISVPLSTLAAFKEMDYLALRINFNIQSYRVIPEAVWLQVAIALIVPQLAGAIPILQGTRISIQEALSGVQGAQMEESGGLNQWLGKIRGVSRPLLISLRNTFRRRVRLILTLITLILGGAIFMATFNVRTYLDDYIARLGKYFIADVNLTLDRAYRIDEIQRVVGQVPGVAAVEGWAAARVEVVSADGTVGDSVNLQAPPVNSKLIEPILLQGRWLRAGDQNQIVLNELFYDRYPTLKLGETIRLRVNGHKTDWVVVGFFQFAGKSGGLFAYTNFDYLAAQTHSPGRAFTYRVVADGREHSLAGQEALGRQIEALLVERGYHVSDLRAGLSLQKSTTGGLDTLTTFLLIMALLMAAVGSIGLMGTMSLNVMERTREIGILRAIGASDGVLMNLVMVEGALIGFISWLLGCLAAIPISMLLSDVISRAVFNTPASFTYNFLGVLVWLGMVIVLALLASALPARSAARLTIREVLAYE